MIHTCRFCKDYNAADSMIKYGVRHWAHPNCGLEHFGAEFFNKLHSWQIRTMPWQFVKQNKQDILAAFPALKEELDCL